MTERVWLAQLWAENQLGVLARSRTLFEELAWLVGRGERSRALAVLPLCYEQPVKNPVDAYLRVWGYLRRFAEADDAVRFFRLLQDSDPGLNRHLYDLVLRQGLWYLHNSRLFLANPCPLLLWASRGDAPALVRCGRDGDLVAPWPDVVASLERADRAGSLVTAALDALVVLRIGDDFIWNPKLDGAAGAAVLQARLRAAGLTLRAAPRRLAAEG